MKAITFDNYGSFDQLRLREIARPSPKDDEALVRVHAVGLHIGDCFSIKGTPFVVRMETGWLKPKQGIPGWELAGVVEAVGSAVTGFTAGDEVFGASHGTCAEYVAVKADSLALKPSGLSLEEAATLPTSGWAALKAVRNVAKVQAGQKILINGASGGVGMFEVQIAKSYGAEVTGVCSGRNVEMVRSIGADHVIDYTQEDFTAGGAQYDVIFDNVENRSLADVRKALKPDGTLILNSGRGAAGLAMMVRLVKPLLISPFSKQSLRRYISTPKHEGLMDLKELVESGKLRVVLDRTFPLEETAAALEYVDGGHVPGKVAVTI
jgi:NADPH:quinone reductase-like Zn-dependent oxidoreductase